MVNQAAIVFVKKAREKADKSVDYFPKDGAICPECGMKNLKTITSRPWEWDVKLRYHRCTNPDCLLCWIKVF